MRLNDQNRQPGQASSDMRGKGFPRRAISFHEWSRVGAGLHGRRSDRAERTRTLTPIFFGRTNGRIHRRPCEKDFDAFINRI